MKNWKNISNETLWIWRINNIMIQITRLIGKESDNIVLQYIYVNLILPGFFRPKIFLGGKNDPSPCNLKNGSLYIHATWQTYTFHLFVNIFNFWWSCYDIDVIYIYIDVTIFKTKGSISETKLSQNMTLVTSDVVPNIFFGKSSMHKRSVQRFIS